MATTPVDAFSWTENLNLRGWMLFTKVWGSHSHNTPLPTSDVDFSGIYVAYSNEFLGLHPPPQTLTGDKPDYQLHEIKKFCDLLIKGNPGILEMLFTDRLCWWDPKWSELRAERKRFLTAKAVKQYLGYSQAQLHRLRHGKSVHAKGGVPGEKWCYHMVRTAWDAERIARGEEPRVWKEGKERETLMAIRTGEMSTELAVKTAEETIARIDATKPWPIPEQPDEDFLNQWLLWIRGVVNWEPKTALSGGLIPYDASVFGGERSSYAAEGKCSFCKKRSATKMTSSPVRRKAYCDSCEKTFRKRA